MWDDGSGGGADGVAGSSSAAAHDASVWGAAATFPGFLSNSLPTCLPCACPSTLPGQVCGDSGGGGNDKGGSGRQAAPRVRALDVAALQTFQCRV